MGGDWEADLYALLERSIDRKTIFFDVGGWIGPVTLFSAQLAKETHTFEPNPLVFSELKENLKANGDFSWASKVTLINAGAHTKDDELKFGCVNENDDSTGSILGNDGDQTLNVCMIDFHKYLQKHAPKHEKVVLKIDIEGGEYSLIPHISNFLKRSDVVLFLSLHPQFLRATFEKKYKSDTFAGKFRIRMDMVLASQKIYRAFGRRQIYSLDGQRISRLGILFSSITSGRFLYDVALLS